MAEFHTATGVIHYELLEATALLQPNPPTVTLLHNFMSTGHAAWGPLLPALSQRYRVLLPDLPGHGRSQGYPPHFNYADIVQQIAALMHHAAAESGHLAGCSMGGMLAQLLVNGHFVQPRTLTLVSTTYSLNPATTGNTAALTPENFKAGEKWMEATVKLHDLHHYPGYYYEVVLPAFRDLTPEIGIDLPLSALRAWDLPVCLIQGAEDEFFPPFIVEQMADALPNAELHIVPEQKHALIFRQAWKVSNLMLAFLNKYKEPNVN